MLCQVALAVDSCRSRLGASRSYSSGNRIGVQQVRSLPDAVARALELHIQTLQSTPADPAAEAPVHQVNSNHATDDAAATGLASAQPINLSKLTGNLCSQCGCHTMVYEEGCRKCYSCGHSEC